MTFKSTLPYQIHSLNIILLLFFSLNFSDDVELANKRAQDDEKSPLVADDDDESSESSRISTPLTISDKILYFLFSISFTMCFMVVLIFWFVLYKPGDYGEIPSVGFYLTVDRHGIIFLLIVIQYLLGKIPIRYLHVIYVVAIAMIFFVHTYFYYLATGKLVYAIFDWRNAPGKAVGYAFGSALVCFVLQLIVFFVDLLKRKIIG